MRAYLGVGSVNIDACNSLISVYIKHHAAKRLFVLDVGCGGGTLLRYLQEPGFYLGVDVSHIAADTAIKEFQTKIKGSIAEFRSCDMRNLSLTQTWDVIVFNEVLYYLHSDDAIAEFDRYAASLHPSGIIVVSMKDDAKSRLLFRTISQKYEWIDGALFQRKPSRSGYTIHICRETPAFLIALFSLSNRR